MIFVTPFYPGLTDYRLYAESLKKHGSCDGHELVVVVQRQDEEAAIEFKAKVASLFSGSSIHVIDAVEEGGLIGVANAMFKAAVYLLKASKPKDGATAEVPLLYNDPTWRAQKTGWLNTIQGEFFASGQPQVLCRWNSNEQGEKVTTGPVLMSKRYAQGTALLPHIPHRTHWRIYLRHELSAVMKASKAIGAGKGSVLKPAYPKK